MKYIVEVREPVPSNLDEIAGKVAASFHISDDKALALLRRAPGAVTRAVSEREADVVSGIFERAGLTVVKRPVEEVPSAPAAYELQGEGAAAGAVPDAVSPAASDAAEPYGSRTQEEPADLSAAAPGAGPVPGAEAPSDLGAEGSTADGSLPAPSETEVWNRPLDAGEERPVDAFSRREELAEDAIELDDGAGAGAAPGVETGAETGAAAVPDDGVGRRSQTPETMRSSRTPEAVRRSQTPETVRSTFTRVPATLEGGGLRRRVALSSVLPALLTLLVMGVAMIVTMFPLLRAQQASRAADTAHAEASALEALTGGMPLDSQTLQTALVDLSRRSEAVLGRGGVRLMVVTDATGAPLAGWYGAATTPAAMPPEVRRQVGDEALSAVAGQVRGGESLTQSLEASWTSVLAMLGLATAGDVYGSAPVMSAGHAIGAVVVGVEPASAGALVGNAFLTTLLVGLVPLLIAILVAMALTRGLRSQVSYLLGAADRISRGDLEEPVGLDSNDELGQLARAIERMRVSLQEGMERLRNRR